MPATLMCLVTLMFVGNPDVTKQLKGHNLVIWDRENSRVMISAVDDKVTANWATRPRGCL